jgi:hypothetical protein
MESDTEHRQCPHEGEEPHNYPDGEDRWEAVDEKAKSLQLHQVPASGLTTAVSLCYANLKENKPFKPDYLSQGNGLMRRKAHK